VASWWQASGDDIVLPVTILPEVAYLLQTRIGLAAEEAFARSLADGELVVELLDDADLPRIAALVRTYRDLPLGFVDASIVATAERLETRDVLTTDRRHFSVVRPRHTRTLTLLP
jgi:predicted nucleic acid-binding protein